MVIADTIVLVDTFRKHHKRVADEQMRYMPSKMRVDTCFPQMCMSTKSECFTVQTTGSAEETAKRGGWPRELERCNHAPCFLSRSNTAGSYGASMSLYSGRFIHASEMYRLTLAYRDLGIRNLFSFNGCEGDEN